MTTRRCLGPTVAWVACLALYSASSTHAAQDYVWIEGEAPTAINVKPNIAGWGQKQLLSGEKWLHVSIDADKVDATVPTEGVLITYAFDAPSEGRFQIWDRIGFEFVRSQFEWRVDGGVWATVKPTDLTTDLMELDVWCEVAWYRLGEAQLGAGPHKLEIRIPRTVDEKGKLRNILYASDALCISKSPFHPNGPYKPGEFRNEPIDAEAERKEFLLGWTTPEAARTSVGLSGVWQVCRDDEQIPGGVAAPIASPPQDSVWTGIEVPGDKNEQRPDLLFAHRLWYRARIVVSEQCAGRSFHLVFPCNNLNTTVFVNGVYCGFEKNPYCRFQIDVTKAVKPGVNEVWVGIRDAWYGHSTNSKDPMKLRKTFNLPIKYFGDGFQDLAYPVWNAARSGILNTPEFVCAGPVETDDVFVKPSVANKRLDAEVTVRNTTAANVSAEVVCQVLIPQTGAVEKAFPATSAAIPAGGEKMVTVGGEWLNAVLWWPDSPNMYVLRTTVKVGGRAIDTFDQSFGFREWGVKGDQFTLNGIVWPVWADLIGSPGTKEEWLAKYRATNQRSMRLMGATQGGIRWMGMTTDDALDWFDRNGVVVRRCGPLDGEAIGYNAIENDPDLKALYHSDIKMDLMQNWRDQMVAQVKGERNHPSVMLWSIENEWLYINCINLYGGLMDQFEAEVKKCSDAVRAVDPTGLTMSDGGGANKDQSMPVHGNHYVFGDQGYDKYPALAYDPNVNGGGRGRWAWDRNRPRFIGEDYFATGINPADYAIFGGEAAFLGKTEARPAAGLLYRILQSGYRWAGQSAWHFWLGEENVAGNWSVYNAPRAVLWKDWDWTVGSGVTLSRNFRIYNNSRFADPIRYSWTCTVAGRPIEHGSGTLTIRPGEYATESLHIPFPTVPVRRDGSFTIVLSAGGKEVFRDVKPLSVLPPRRPSPVPGLLVYDPAGSVATFLKSRGVAFKSLPSLAALPASGKVLIVGKDAVTVEDSSSSRLAAWAVGGRRAIVLDQKYPLKYQAIPAEIEPSSATGRIAFGEDMGHPALRGLRQQDFFTWGADEIVYRNAYLKPTRGAKSLVQCHDRLQNSALVEVPIGSGLLLLCQMAVGEKVGTVSVAQTLLCNLIDYAATYRQTFRPVALVAPAGSLLAKTCDTMGLSYKKAADPVAAISQPGTKLDIVAATPENLKALASNPAMVTRFTAAGGYIVLNGLTPEGLASYNKLVGFDHMIRPFQREKVQFPAFRSPLTAGLNAGDIVMLSGERIFGWTADEFVASDEFSYVVDLEDVAPFMKFPNEFVQLMVSGFRNADAWKYIVNLPLKDADWRLALPKPQPISGVTWYPNQNYNYVTKFEMSFDGKDPQTFDLKVNDDPQTFAVKPVRTAKDVRLRIVDVQKKPGYDGEVTGLDNIRIWAQRPADFHAKVRPLLNIGAMVEYPRGPGGIVLCNLLFKETEAVPVNAVKKRTILATLLRNLDAPFSGGKTVIAGAGLAYTPIDISKQCTQYRDEKGWFGDRSFTFKDLPTGKQTFAGVTYQVFDFPTSPVPNAIMLAGGGVPNNPPEAVTGIPVHLKADALFFLQAARIDQRMNRDEIRDRRQFEMAKYVVHYADGHVEAVPIVAERDVDDYRRQTPAALPGAQIAWTRHYPGTEYTAVAYSKQWNNPRPNVEIATIDLVYGKDRRGVPALLAVTAAKVGK